MNSRNGDWLPSPKFPFGRVVVTPGVLEKLDRTKIDELLRRHSVSLSMAFKRKLDRPKIDELLRRHGELDPGTLADEEDSIRNEFTVDGVGVIWIITEPDRSVTTVLLPSEY